jgi:iron-sulfur cluster assembly protein
MESAYLTTMPRPRFQVVSVTDRAADRVREILANADTPAEGIRIGVKKGGCAGMEYTVDLVREPPPADDVVDVGGAKVFVNPQATLFLLGTEMDFEVTKLRTGFVFRNPNQTSACGCGESVEIKPASEELLAEARA